MGNECSYEASAREDYCGVVDLANTPNENFSIGNRITNEGFFNQAQSCQLIGRFEEAVSKYTKILVLAKDQESLFSRGLCYMKMGKPRLAIKDFSECIKVRMETRENSSVKLHKCFHHVALCHKFLKEFEVSESNITEAIRLNPKSGIYFACRARLFYERRAFRKSLSDYDVSISLLTPKLMLSRTERKRRNQEYVIYERGRVLFQMGEYKRALNDFLMYLKLQPDDFDTQCSIGRCYHILKMYQKALDIYLQKSTQLEISSRKNNNSSVRSLHQLPKLFLLMGGVCFDKGDYNQAVVNFTKSVVTALRNKIAIKRKRGKLSNFQIIDGYIHQAVMNRGSSYFKIQEYEKSIEDYTYVMETFNNKNTQQKDVLSEMLFQRGLSYERLGHLSLALQDFEKSRELAPNTFKRDYLLGTTFLKLKEYQKSLSNFLKCLEMNKEHAMTYNNIGLCYKNLEKEHDKAMEYFTISMNLLKPKLENDEEARRDIFFPLCNRSKLYFQLMKKSDHHFGVSDYLKLRELLKTFEGVSEREEKEILENFSDLEDHIDRFLKDKFVDVKEKIRTSSEYCTIGNGISATIFRVEFKTPEGPKEILAIKDFSKGQSELDRDLSELESDFGKRMMRTRSLAEEEALVLFSKNHPNIIKCLGCSKDGMLMEYGKNHSVREYISFRRAFRKNRKYHMTFEHKMKIINGMNSAMVYLHDTCEICHRNLKLENVVIMDDDFDIRLIDFGFAKDTLSIAKTKDFFIAPEILLKLKKDDWFHRKCDVWSFGVCGYILMYEVEDVKSVLSKCFYSNLKELGKENWQVKYPKKDFSGSSRERKVVEIIKRCLCKNPIERLEFAQIQKLLEDV